MKQNRFSIECFSSIDDQCLVDAWNRLAETGTGTAFQSYDYVSAVHNAFFESGSHKPHYVALRDQADNRIVLIMSMVERRRLNLRILETLDYDVIDYARPIYCPDVFSESTAADQATIAFLEYASKFDVLKSKNWSIGAGALEGVQPLLDKSPRTCEVTYSVPLLAEQFESYRKSNSAFKQSLKKMRRMKKEFGAEIDYFTETGDIDAAFDKMFEHRRVRFQAIGKMDGMADPRRQKLFRSIARQRCPKKEALFLGIRINDDWIATSFALIQNGVMNAQLSSFADGPWSRHSPGVVTMALEIEWAYANGLSTYNLGPGKANYKGRFGVDELHRVIVKEPMSPVGTLYLAAHRTKRGLKDAVKKTLSILPDYKLPKTGDGSSFKGQTQSLGI